MSGARAAATTKGNNMIYWFTSKVAGIIIWLDCAVLLRRRTP